MKNGRLFEILYLLIEKRTATAGELAERLGDLHERGVVLKPGFTLKDLYDERVPLYERYADITLDCSNKSIRQVMEEIKSKYE